jgi:HEAT repeat protein
MKRLSLTFLLVFFTFTAFTDDTEVYSFFYEKAKTNTEQLEILKSISDKKISVADDFYTKALRRLVSEYSNINNTTQLGAADNQAAILVTVIGDRKISSSAPDLWQVVQRFRNAEVRSEALVSLGKLQARAYLPQIISLLNDLNSKPAEDRLYGEQLACGAIIALEKYADPEGYLPVYFTLTSWYGDRVTDQTEKSLPRIAADPAPFMSQIIKSPGYSLEIKYRALQHTAVADISGEKKAGVAADALNEAWKISSSDIADQLNLYWIRKVSLKIFYYYGVPDNSAYPLIARCYTQGMDTSEKEDAVRALEKIGTIESARILDAFLIELNTKHTTGNLSREDRYLVSIVITALGNIGNPDSKISLTPIIHSDWPAAVKSLARNALDRLD